MTIPSLPTYPTPWSLCNAAIKARYKPSCRILPFVLLAHEFWWLARERQARGDESAALANAACAERLLEVLREVKS